MLTTMDRFVLILLAVTAFADDHGPTVRHPEERDQSGRTDKFGQQYGGSGPYKSVSALSSEIRNRTGSVTADSSKYSFEVKSLVNHTFYQPLQSAGHSSLRLPVIVWGNGGCSPWLVSLSAVYRYKS
jgi:hypothetical protein